MKRESYVTLVTNAEYCIGALVLAASLRQTNTSKELTVLITTGVTDPFRQLLRDAFDHVVEVQGIENPDRSCLEFFERGELLITFTKIQCWTLIQFSKAVFLDADTIVLHNIDELFDREELSAVPDPCWPDCFNTGVFVYRPSLETHKALLKLVTEVGSFDGGDQGLLNTYFSTWLQKGISHRLSYVYNCICRITDECEFDFYTSAPAWVQFGGAIRLAHFAGPIKPWHRVSAAKNCSLYACQALLNATSNRRGISRTSGMLAYWWSLFLILVRPKLSPDMPLSNFRFEQRSTGGGFQPQQESLQGLSPFAPYVPTFHSSDDRWREPAQHRPSSPPKMLPYHPEFHETRWDYLHYGQRMDQDNRFQEFHEVPKPVAPLVQSFSFSHGAPAPPRPATPPVPKDQFSTHEGAFFFSSQQAHQPKFGPPTPVQCVQSPSERPFPEPVAHIPETQTAVWQPKPSQPHNHTPSYSLECRKCKAEMAKEQATPVTKDHQLESGRPTLHKSIRQKTKRRGRKAAHSYGSTEVKSGTLASGRVISSGRSVSSSFEISFPKRAFQPPLVKTKVKDSVVKKEILRDVTLPVTQMVLPKRISTTSKQEGARVKYKHKSRHDFEGLDLATPRANASVDSHKRTDKMLLEAHNLEIPTKAKCDKLKLISSTPSEAVRRPKLENVEYSHSTFDTDSVIKSSTVDEFLPHSLYRQENHAGAHELAIGLFLHKSKRRTSRDLRKSRDKLKERGFDRQVSQATWENRQEVEKMCKLLSSAGSSKTGIPGELTKLNVGTKLCPRHEWIETERMYAWERGEIDYTGTDRFANILAKLCETMVKSGGERNVPYGLDIS